MKPPTEKQIEYAKSLGIETTGKSFRVLQAEISDHLEEKAENCVEKLELRRNVMVKYVGPREDMPEYLTISSIGRNGYVYFQGCYNYCRPWFLEPLTISELMQLAEQDGI